MVNMPPPVAGVPHVPPVCVTSWIPAGMMSANWTLDTETAFGFVTVIVAVEVPFKTTVAGLKLLVIVRASACASRRPVDKKTRRATKTTIGVKERCDRARVDRAAVAHPAVLCCTASISRRYYNRSLADDRDAGPSSEILAGRPWIRDRRSGWQHDSGRSARIGRMNRGAKTEEECFSRYEER